MSGECPALYPSHALIAQRTLGVLVGRSTSFAYSHGGAVKDSRQEPAVLNLFSPLQHLLCIPVRPNQFALKELGLIRSQPEIKLSREVRYNSECQQDLEGESSWEVWKDRPDTYASQGPLSGGRSYR